MPQSFPNGDMFDQVLGGHLPPLNFLVSPMDYHFEHRVFIIFSCNHLSMKEGCFVLFCSYEIHHQIGMLHIVFLASFESS